MKIETIHKLNVVSIPRIGIKVVRRTDMYPWIYVWMEPMNIGAGMLFRSWDNARYFSVPDIFVIHRRFYSVSCDNGETAALSLRRAGRATVTCPTYLSRYLYEAQEACP
jgi:hypothetical protein